MDQKIFGYVRFRSAQGMTCPGGEMDGHEWFELCEKDEVGDDGSVAKAVVLLSDLDEQAADSFGRAIDDLESLVAGLALPMPPQLHLDQLRKIMPDKIEILKWVYVESTGENPWA